MDTATQAVDTASKSIDLVGSLAPLIPIIITSIITAYLAHHFSSRKSKKENQVSSSYLAARLALYFENYAIDSAHQLSMTDLHIQSRGSEGKPTYNILEAKKLPKDDAYKLLDHTLRDDVYNFRNEIELRILSIQNDPRITDEEENLERTIPETAIMGLFAITIAKKLRSKYDLPDRTLEFDGWNIGDYLNTMIDRPEQQTTPLFAEDLGAAQETD